MFEEDVLFCNSSLSSVTLEQHWTCAASFLLLRFTIHYRCVHNSCSLFPALKITNATHVTLTSIVSTQAACVMCRERRDASKLRGIITGGKVRDGLWRSGSGNTEHSPAEWNESQHSPLMWAIPGLHSRIVPPALFSTYFALTFMAQFIIFQSRLWDSIKRPGT